MGAMPGVHLRLQTIALRQQSGVDGSQVMNECVKPFPKTCTIDPGSRKNLCLNKLIKRRCDLKSMAGGACSHVGWTLKNFGL